jgi:hypothetical protein
MLAFIRRNWWLGVLLGLVAGFALGAVWRSLMLNRGYDAGWDADLYQAVGVEMGGAILVVGLILLALELIHRRLGKIMAMLQEINTHLPKNTDA